MSGRSAPVGKSPGIAAGELQGSPQRDRYQIDHRDIQFPFERSRQRGAVEVGAEDDDSIGAVSRHSADHASNRRRRDLAEREIVAQSEVPLRVRGDPLLGPDVTDPPLHVVGIG